MRLLYAFHSDDPTPGTNICYHGFERRGTKSVSLLSSSQPSLIFNDDDIKYIEFRNRNVCIALYYHRQCSSNVSVLCSKQYEEEEKI